MQSINQIKQKIVGMKRILLGALALGFTVSTFGQLSFGGQPLSYSGKALDNDKAVHSEVMPGYDQSAVDAENELRDKNGEMSLFAYPYETNFSLSNSGTWTTLPSGDRVWKIRIESPAALAINLLYEDFYLPEGSRLFVYNEDRTEFLGSFTEANNHSSMEFITGNVHGDVIYVEYFEPKSVIGQGSFTIGHVNHAYRYIDPLPQDEDAELRGGDPCQVDIHCSPEGDSWTDQENGACRILVNGTGYCSGSLINNTSFDCAPYVLYAQHCWPSGSPGNVSNTSIFYFLYERSGCGTGPANSTGTTGCIVRAAAEDGGGNNGSDYLLVELTASGISSTLQGWGCYWNGWDANDVSSGTYTSGVSIHHPAGGRKKISTYGNFALTTSGWGISGTHWRVRWDATPNGHGVTEGGSSGSPIFNSAGRIVGQLTGGGSYCTVTTASDYYGKMSYNWNSNPGSQTLEMWLDPGSTGTMSMDGTYSPCAPPAADDAGISNINAPTGTICTATFTPEVVLRNYGGNTLTSVTIYYDIDGGATQTYNWTGSLATSATETVTLSSMTTTAGPHTFNAWTDLPNGNADGNTGNDANAEPFTVVLGGGTIDFTLTTDCWGSETTWELREADNDLLYSGGPYSDIAGGEVITEQWCLADGCYEFIINDSYGDGMYGSQWGTCSVDGDYTIMDGGTTLASLIAPNADFGNQETNSFTLGTPLSVTANGTDVTCNGGSDGQATASPTGGDGDYSYSWSPLGGTGATATGLPATTVTVTVTDGTGCTANDNVTIGQPTVVSGSISGTTDSDCITATGTATVAGSGGTPGYTYQWDASAGSQTTATATGLAAGTYTVIVTDGNGCSSTAIVATVANANAPTAVPSGSAESCAGDCDGTVSATASGGSGSGYTYAWDGGLGSGATQTGVCAGTYNVIVTDGAGCASAATPTTVTAGPAYPVAGFSYTPNPACAGENITFNNTTSGSATYDWDFGDGGNATTTSPTYSYSAQGTYTVWLVADNSGCADSTSMSVNINCTVGVGDTWLDNAITIYPNPSNGIVNLDVETELTEQLVVEVANSIGQIIDTFTLNGSGIVTLDMNNEAEGLYYITIKSEDISITRKISIVK